MGVQDTTSVRYAAAQLINTQKPEGDEQIEESTLEQESPEEAQEQDVLEGYEEVADQDDGVDEEYEEPDDEGRDADDGDAGDEPMYSVKVDGTEYEVNLQELIKGYQLEKNTTKKSQQLSDERKQLQELKQDLEAQRTQYLEYTSTLANQQYAGVEKAKEQLKGIDREDDPIGYLTKQAEIADMERALQGQVEQYQRAQAEQQEQFNAQRQLFMQEQAAILAQKLDDWNDPEKSVSLRKHIVDYATREGYSAAELANVVDARDIVVLNKARLYDELMAKRGAIANKKAPAKPRVQIKSSASPSNSTKKARAVKERRDTLTRTGKPKDAAALMLELMQNRSTKR